MAQKWGGGEEGVKLKSNGAIIIIFKGQTAYYAQELN